MTESVALGFLYSITKDAWKISSKYFSFSQIESLSNIEEHLIWQSGWSASIQIFGMVKPKYTDSNTIPLRISTRPRKFFDLSSQKIEDLNEIDLINQFGATIILGDPGSGKTTLIKRISRMLMQSDSESALSERLPLLILGRDITKSNDLMLAIRRIIKIEEVSFDPRFYKKTLDEAKQSNTYESKFQDLKDEWEKTASENTERAILYFLDKSNCCILIDGIDEIEPDARRKFDAAVTRLISSCPQLKILATCRSGDWTTNIEGVNLVQVAPLTDSEIKEIAAEWCEKPDDFLNAIKSVPYKDTLNRPLILTMLIVLFDQSAGELPDVPADLYQKIVWLLIERWDKTRNLNRKSQFENFMPERKFRFLSAIAFHLLVEQELKRFKRSSLKKAFDKINERFGINEFAFDNLFEELESHTGIIVQSGFNNFEFCHLTVQEYLAANHLIGMGFDPNTMEILRKFPATMAVASSLSAEPSDYISRLLNLSTKKDEKSAINGGFLSVNFLNPYFDRLKLERPELYVSSSLGASLLILISKLETKHLNDQNLQSAEWDDYITTIENFCHQDVVAESILRALPIWGILPEQFSSGGVYALIPHHGLLDRDFSDLGIEIPRKIFFREGACRTIEGAISQFVL